MADVGAFRQHLLEAEPRVIDAEGIHHEFVSGMHGQKIDCDEIPTGSPLYSEWVDVNEDFIRENYEELPMILLGVANGTNRLALDVARRFNGESLGLVSKKDPENSKKLFLPDVAKKIIQVLEPELVVVLEDVGTTGSNSVQVAEAAIQAGAQDVEVLVTWQRREELEKLSEKAIKNRAIIHEPLPTYSLYDCMNLEDGFCHRGWEFIPRVK